MAKHVSKFLSLVLRHDPGRIGIVLDDAGWTDVPALLAACAAHGVPITRAELAEVVATSDKQRFALDGDRIRANQGHSLDVDLRLDPATPPAALYHGTVDDAIVGIRAQGIVRGTRHHVHLSVDVETAKRVGGRRGTPIVLNVRAGEMVAAGHVFYRSPNGVWLVDHVPVEFVDLPARRGAGDGSRKDKVAIAKATLAACEAGFYLNARGERVELAAAIEDAQAGTVLHELGDALDRSKTRGQPSSGRSAAKQGSAAPWSDGSRATRIEVTGESTIEALIRLAGIGGTVGCLNFASAKNPGGGFLGGAQAQEEALARASALYPCLLAQPAMYERNRASRSALYLDLALYSPAVPFIRTDDGGWLDQPVLASVITCAAPNAGALRQHGRFDADEVEAVLRRRARFIVEIAIHHGIDHLVLGAWGAGVFGNAPELVARAFADHLPEGVFASVVFAVLGEDSANHRAFVDAFG